MAIAGAATCVLHEVGSHGEHEGHLLAQPSGFWSARRKRKGTGQSRREIEIAFPPALFRKDILDGLLQYGQSPTRITFKEGSPVDAAQEIDDSFMASNKLLDRQFLIPRRLFSISLAIGRECLLQFGAEAHV